MRRSTHGRALAAVVVLAPAAALVATALATKSLWGDEILSLEIASQGGRPFLAALAADYHPPLYFLLLAAWTRLFGDGEAGLRIFQGLQAAAFLAAALALFRKAYPPRRFHPLFVLLAISVPLWLFAPMLRYYMLSTALASWSTLLLLRFVDSPSPARACALGASYVALFYTDYPTSAILVPHALFALRRPGVPRRVYLWTLVAAAAAFAPWKAVVIGQALRLVRGTTVADLNDSLIAIPLKLGYGAYALLAGETVYPIEPAGIAAAVLYGVVAVLFARGARRRAWEPLPLLAAGIVLWGLLATAVTTTVVSRHTSFVYTCPRTLYALPFAYIAMGAVYDRLGSPALRAGFVGSIAVLSLYGLVNLAANRHFVMPVYAAPWKEVVARLEGRPGVLVCDESPCYAYAARHRGQPQPQLLEAATLAEFLAAIDTPEPGTGARPPVALVLTERESSASTLPAGLADSLAARRRLESHEVLLPYDATYRWMKRVLLERDPGVGKIHLYRYAGAAP